MKGDFYAVVASFVPRALTLTVDSRKALKDVVHELLIWRAVLQPRPALWIYGVT
jgi:hypothetical protein